MNEKTPEENKVKLADVRHLLEEGLLRFYFCEGRKRRSLYQAYWRTLKRYFTSHRNERGRAMCLRTLLPPAEQLPTYRQFRYVKDRMKEPMRSAIKARYPKC